MPNFQKGFASGLLVLLLLVAGIGVGTYLVGQRTNLLPKAAAPQKVRAPETSFSLVSKKDPSKPIIFNQQKEGSSSGVEVDDVALDETIEEVSQEDISTGTNKNTFYKGKKIAVRLIVASDIDASNLFSAKINFPKDLLEVSSIQTGGIKKIDPVKVKNLTCDNQGQQCPAGYSCALPAIACAGKDQSKCLIKGKCTINQVGSTEPGSIGSTVPGSVGATNVQGVKTKNTGQGQVGKGSGNIPAPSCQPRPACLDGNPRCLLPEPANGWCPPSPSVKPSPKPNSSYQYFIQNWVENKYDNNVGIISLIGAVDRPGFKTDIKKSPALMATIYFVVKNIGEGEIKFDDSSVIYRNSDNQNILQIKRNLSFMIVDPQAPSKLPQPSNIACPAIAIVCPAGTYAETYSDNPSKCPVQVCLPEICSGITGEICPSGFSCLEEHPENPDQGGKCVRNPSPSITPNPSVKPVRIKGDGNGDGKIDLADLSVLISNSGKSGKDRPELDLNNDGRINLTDFFILIKMLTTGG